MPMAAQTVLYSDGFYYWPDYDARDGAFIPVVRFVRVEDHIRAPTAPRTHEMPGEFATVAEALREAQASVHHYAVPGSLALLWAFHQ
ncbi:hypothetical protein SAMD00023378_3953 [Ralstonia sp. NT80]|nr:hypothetical protein SAMD00023378_3953 [Ralstonia sp. NT80]